MDNLPIDQSLFVYFSKLQMKKYSKNILNDIWDRASVIFYLREEQFLDEEK